MGSCLLCQHRGNIEPAGSVNPASALYLRRDPGRRSSLQSPERGFKSRGGLQLEGKRCSSPLRPLASGSRPSPSSSRAGRTDGRLQAKDATHGQVLYLLECYKIPPWAWSPASRTTRSRREARSGARSRMRDPSRAARLTRCQRRAGREILSRKLRAIPLGGVDERQGFFLPRAAKRCRPWHRVQGNIIGAKPRPLLVGPSPEARDFNPARAGLCATLSGLGATRAAAAWPCSRRPCPIFGSIFNTQSRISTRLCKRLHRHELDLVGLGRHR